VSRAAEGAVQAAERAGNIVADRTEPSEHREIRVEPAEVQVKPARAQVRTRPAKAPGSRRRMPTPYEERTLEELQERAKELGIEGRASMTKDELITTLRKQRTSSRRPAAPAQAKPERATEPARRQGSPDRPLRGADGGGAAGAGQGGWHRGSRLDDQGRADHEPSRPALAAP
jgi:hypothetical protein